MVRTSPSALMLRTAALASACAMALSAGRGGPLGAWTAVGLAAGGYGLSLLLFAAFPRLRRNDLVLGVAAFLLTLSLLRYLDGAPTAATPLLFGLAGAASAWLPSRVERFRREERRARRRGDRRAIGERPQSADA